MENSRKKYIEHRLTELSLLAGDRELEEIEQREERRLLKELKEIEERENN